jgi:hypothetical protein
MSDTDEGSAATCGEPNNHRQTFVSAARTECISNTTARERVL